MGYFFLGVYVTGGFFTFMVVWFAVLLGGRGEDMWKPFVYAAIWPLAVAKLLLEAIRAVVFAGLLVMLVSPAAATEPPDIWEVFRDPRTKMYTKASLPPMYEMLGQLFPLGYNSAARNGVQIDPTGTPNNEYPWLHTGGLDHCEPSYVKVTRVIRIPPDTEITIRRGVPGFVAANRLDYSRMVGHFPVGTVCGEFLTDDGRVFETRVRYKTKDVGRADDWETHQVEYGGKPAGYYAVTNCVDCHADIGKHANLLEPATRRPLRDWYGTVRGLEPGGPIHWHPFVPSASKAGAAPQIRDDVKAFVRFVN